MSLKVTSLICVDELSIVIQFTACSWYVDTITEATLQRNQLISVSEVIQLNYLHFKLEKLNHIKVSCSLQSISSAVNPEVEDTEMNQDMILVLEDFRDSWMRKIYKDV